MTATAYQLSALAVLAVICGVGGYLAGVSTRPSEARGAAEPASGEAAELIRLSADDELGALPAEVRAAVEEGAGAVAGGDFVAAFAGLRTIADPGAREQAMIELIGKLDAAQIGALIGLMVEDEFIDGDELLGVMDDEIGAFALLDRWVQLDPEAAAAFALRNASEGFDGIMSIVAAAFIAQRDVDRARALFEDMRREHPEIDADFGEAIYYGVAFDDPARALRLFREDGAQGGGDLNVGEVFDLVGARSGEALDEVLALPPGELRSGLVDDLFVAWGDSDPHAALAAAAALAHRDGRDEVLKGVIGSLAQQDPLAALAAIGLLPDTARGGATADVIGEWSDRDPSAAMGWARENLTGEAFGDALMRAAQHIDPEQALALVEGMSPDERRSYFAGTNFDREHFIRRLATTNAALAVSWFAEHVTLGDPASPPVSGSSDWGSHGGYPYALVVDEFAREAAEQGLDAALELAGTLPASAFRDRFLGAIAEAAGRSDPAATFAWAAGLAGAEGELAMARAAAGWAEGDPLAAADWASKSGAPGALDGALEGWAQHDAEGAYRWLVGAMGDDPDEFVRAITDSDLLDTWTRQDPAAAAAAMLGLPEHLAPGKLADVTGEWATEEPTAVSNFINEKLVPGPLRDAAVAALVDEIKGGDPNGAAAWARTISDEALMYSLLDSLATQ